MVLGKFKANNYLAKERTALISSSFKILPRGFEGELKRTPLTFFPSEMAFIQALSKESSEIVKDVLLLVKAGMICTSDLSLRSTSNLKQAIKKTLQKVFILKIF